MKKKIALVTGGYSSKAEISYQSLVTIDNNIDRHKYDAYVIDITSEGWFYKNDEGEDASVDKNDFSIIVNNRKINFDGVLMSVHGTPGEDGKLQGYFDCLGLHYTGCDASTSALIFNKRYMVAIAASAGIQVPKSLHIFRNDIISEEDIFRHLKFPVYVKPNSGGSGIGISKVKEPSAEIDVALQKAFNEDEQVLIEEFIAGRKFAISLLKSKGEIITLPVMEITSKKKSFDFNVKCNGISEEMSLANIEEFSAEKITKTAEKIYSVLNCRGVVRIDFIYNEETAELFMLELNTMPNQSAAGLVLQQVKAKGWTLQQFYTMLIQECWQ